jgi:exosortase C (VPDSG-CTERM-specific)
VLEVSHQTTNDSPVIEAGKPATIPGAQAQPGVESPASRGNENTQDHRAVRSFAVLVALLTCAFAVPLWELLRFSLKSSLFSHVPLIPLISAWWIWKRPGGEAAPHIRSSPAWAALAAVAAGLLCAGYWLWGRGSLAPAGYLGLMTTSYLLALLAAALATLGGGVVRAFRFPLLFLVFMIPWPQPLVDAVETGLQYASAEAAHVMLVLSGLPVLRDGLVFRVPGLTFEVAQECSGIRSSLVLFITSVLGAQLLLRTRWRRWVLVLAVLPLGVLRNGFRILTLALLCVHVDPAMIDSPLHHRGGPIFFVLSLGPFFLLLWWLRRGERKAGAAAVVG